MNFFKAVSPVYDWAMDLVGHEKILNQILAKVKISPTDKIADVGGGTGLLLEHLPPENQVTIIDESESMLARVDSNNRSGEIQLEKSSLLEYSAREEKFDLIFCLDALHHFEKVAENIDKMLNMLTEDGTLVIMEFDRRVGKTKLLSFGEKILGEPGNFKTPKELKFLIEQAGYNSFSVDLSSWQFLIFGGDSPKKRYNAKN